MAMAGHPLLVLTGGSAATDVPTTISADTAKAAEKAVAATVEGAATSDRTKTAYHSSMSGEQIQSVGFGGDGDEIYAIRNVEAVFRVKLDYTEASNWFTAGDVYRSLSKVLPADETAKPDLWDRFAVALAEEIGVDPNTIRPESPLLSHSRFWARIADASAAVWILIVVAVAIGLGLGLLYDRFE